MKMTILFTLFLFVHMARGGDDQARSLMMIEPPDRHLTGNLRVDLFGQTDMVRPAGFQSDVGLAAPRKSPWIAGGLSFVLPGAGEFYAENYWRSATFLAVEVGAWVVASIYDKKGNRQTDFFEHYADANWSVVKYAEWTLDKATRIHPGITNLPTDTELFIFNGSNKTGVRWSVLNDLERSIGNWYTHTLPPYGEQQYYELIGKYPQFNQGWAEADSGWFLPDYPRVPQDLYYEKERARADDFYGVASTFVSIVIVNHVLSAVDAALAANSFNIVHAQLGMQSVPDRMHMTKVPVLKMRWEF